MNPPHRNPWSGSPKDTPSAATCPMLTPAALVFAHTLFVPRKLIFQVGWASTMNSIKKCLHGNFIVSGDSHQFSVVDRGSDTHLRTVGNCQFSDPNVNTAQWRSWFFLSFRGIPPLINLYEVISGKHVHALKSVTLSMGKDLFNLSDFYPPV